MINYQLHLLYLKLADIYERVPNFDQAIKIYESAMAILEKLQGCNSIQIAEILEKIGMLQVKLNQLVDAIYCFKQALEISYYQKPLDLKFITQIQSCLGQSYFLQEDYNQAIYHMQRALEQCQPEEVSKLLNDIGQAQMKVDKLTEAVTNTKKALEIDQSEKPANNEKIVRDLVNLAGIYTEQKDFDQSIATFEQALKLALEHYGAQSAKVIKHY